MKGMRIFLEETSQSSWSLQHCECCIGWLHNRLSITMHKLGKINPFYTSLLPCTCPPCLLNKSGKHRAIGTTYWLNNHIYCLLVLFPLPKTPCLEMWEGVVLEIMLPWILHLRCILSSNWGSLLQRMLWLQKIEHLTITESTPNLPISYSSHYIKNKHKSYSRKEIQQ